MAGESSETLHTLVITAVKDETTRVRVAHVLSRVTKDVSAEYIRDRMAGLPWTITRKATRKKAIRLVQLLERVGATVKVTPPLEEGFKLEMGETRLVPGTDLLTRTQMITSEELVRAPAKGVTEKPGLSNRSPAAPSPKKPTPPEPSSETQFEAGFEIGPLSLSGILDRSFRICRAHFWRLLAILAIPWLVTVAVMLAMMMVLALAGFTAKAIDKSSVDTLLLLGGLLIPSALILVIAMFYLSPGALIHAVSSIYLGRRVVVREAYRFVIAKLGRYFLTSFLMILAVSGFFTTTVIVAVALFFLFREFTSSGWWSAFTWLPLSILPVYGTIKLLLFDKVVIIEDSAYLSALRRSWSLLKGKAAGEWPRGYFLRLFILLHLFALFTLTMALLFQVPAAIIELLMSDIAMLGKVLGQLLSNAGSLVAGLFNSVCMVVFYYDIRNRKEGFDLKMLATITQRDQSV